MSSCTVFKERLHKVRFVETAAESHKTTEMFLGIWFICLCCFYYLGH